MSDSSDTEQSTKSTETENDQDSNEDDYEDDDDYYDRRRYRRGYGWGYDSPYEDEIDEDQFYRRSKRKKAYPCVTMNPVTRTEAPTLETIACATVAVSLWNNINISSKLFRADCYCAKEASCWNSLKEKAKKLCSELPIPNAVQNRINLKSDEVLNEIISWATYHFRSVFLNEAQDYVVYNLVGDLIWHCDGRIDCVETAKNIAKSKSPRLNDVARFNFLCTYCLEDEMKQMSPVVLNTVQNDVNFDLNPLIRYWNRYFRQKLHKIQKDGNLSLDCFMFRHQYVDNWPAKEYFFNRLSADEQVVNAIWLIDQKGFTYQKKILLKLNESQRISVYLERSVKIIKNYAKTKINWSDVLMVWSEIRNLITGEQFASLFSALLEAKAIVLVLEEIWTSADTEFKHRFFNYDNHSLVKKLLNSYDWSENISFVIMVLQDLGADLKTPSIKQIFDDFCETFFSQRENLQFIDLLLEAYYAEEWKQFKEYFVLNSKSIKTFCFKYFLSGDLKALNEMLTYLFYEMPDRISVYKRNLLLSPDGILECVELLGTKTATLNEIIADTFPSTDLANVFRKKLIFSTSVIGKLKASMIAKENLNVLKNIVDGFLTSNEDKLNVKKALIEELISRMVDFFRVFDESYVQPFFLWFFVDENGVKKFKRSIPVDRLFDSLLKSAAYAPVQNRWSAVRGSTNNNSYDSLNQFLLWYFESPIEVKKYKLQRIQNYTKMDLITSLCRKRRPEEVERLRTLMKWFFDNDEIEIAKFKRNRCGKIVEVF